MDPDEEQLLQLQRDLVTVHLRKLEKVDDGDFAEMADRIYTEQRLFEKWESGKIPNVQHNVCLFTMEDKPVLVDYQDLFEQLQESAKRAYKMVSFFFTPDGQPVLVGVHPCVPNEQDGGRLVSKHREPMGDLSLNAYLRLFTNAAIRQLEAQKDTVSAATACKMFEQQEILENWGPMPGNVVCLFLKSTEIGTYNFKYEDFFRMARDALMCTFTMVSLFMMPEGQALLAGVKCCAIASKSSDNEHESLTPPHRVNAGLQRHAKTTPPKTKNKGKDEMKVKSAGLHTTRRTKKAESKLLNYRMKVTLNKSIAQHASDKGDEHRDKKHGEDGSGDDEITDDLEEGGEEEEEEEGGGGEEEREDQPMHDVITPIVPRTVGDVAASIPSSKAVSIAEKLRFFDLKTQGPLSKKSWDEILTCQRVLHVPGVSGSEWMYCVPIYGFNKDMDEKFYAVFCIPKPKKKVQFGERNGILLDAFMKCKLPVTLNEFEAYCGLGKSKKPKHSLKIDIAGDMEGKSLGMYISTIKDMVTRGMRRKYSHCNPRVARGRFVTRSHSMNEGAKNGTHCRQTNQSKVAKYNWDLTKNVVEDDKVREISVTEIRRPHQALRSLDRDKVEALKISIAEVGLLEPIDVLEVDGQIYGFSGCHRYQAHEEMGKPTIKCRVHKATKQVLRYHMM